MVHRLEHYGHDVEHVDFVSELGKGSSDARIARYSLDEDRLLLTNDDDFLTDIDASAYSGLLFIEDETLSTDVIADIVQAISDAIPQERIDRPIYVSTNWL